MTKKEAAIAAKKHGLFVVKVKEKARAKDKWDIFEIVEASPRPDESLELIQTTKAENACSFAT